MPRRLPGVLFALAPVALSASLSAAALADDVPHLQWGEKIRCMQAPDGRTVRVQCWVEAGKTRCYVAPNETKGGGPLDHIDDCAGLEPDGAYGELGRAGATIVPAIAESPPGYARDERGRAFQVKFDLLNRFYLGASWAPTIQRGGLTPANLPLGRAQVETGIQLSTLSASQRARYDFHVLEGAVTFDDLQVSGLLLSYDYQHMHRRPAFWITSFVGAPRVYPLASPLGWGFRVLDVSDRAPGRHDSLDAEITEVHLSLNPIQSSDLYSHVRIEAGGNVGERWNQRSALSDGLDSGQAYAGFSSALESRLSLGEGGLHYMFADVRYRHPVILGGVEKGASSNRLTGSLAYEGVLLAIDDQPISLRLAAMGSTRDDAPKDARDVELRFTAGLRVSFWAPPRTFEALPDIEDP